jgi:hypothetical protein
MLCGRRTDQSTGARDQDSVLIGHKTLLRSCIGVATRTAWWFAAACMLLQACTAQ